MPGLDGSVIATQDVEGGATYYVRIGGTYATLVLGEPVQVASDGHILRITLYWRSEDPKAEFTDKVEFVSAVPEGNTSEIELSALCIAIDKFRADYEEPPVDLYDDSMDGDAASALSSAGWGTDEDYCPDDFQDWEFADDGDSEC